MNLVGALVLLILLLLIVGASGSLQIGHCPSGQAGVCITWTH